MERHLSSQELRAQLAEAIDAVRLRGDRYIIERRGRAVAALVPLHWLDKEREQRARLADLAEEIRANADGLSEGDAMDLALKEVAAHRAGKRTSKGKPR